MYLEFMLYIFLSLTLSLFYIIISNAITLHLIENMTHNNYDQIGALECMEKLQH